MENRQSVGRALRRAVPLAAAACLAVAGVGCGTRVPENASGALSAPLGAAQPAPDPATVPAAGSSGTTPAQEAATAAGSASGSLGRAGAPSPATAPSGSGTPTTPGRTAQPKVGAAGTNAAPAGSPSRAATASGGSAPLPAPSAPAPTATGAKSPVVVASVGTLSGPVGAILLPMVQGTQVWVKSANARGGVNGHPVNLIVYDDRGDPATHGSQVKEAVEQKGALAFLMNTEPITGQSAVGYLESKRIPVIGVPGAEPWGEKSPMYFPQKTVTRNLYVLHPQQFASQLVPRGITKWGTLVCAEAQGCKDIAKVYTDEAGRLGYQVVYQGQSTVAQPDFTAECLAARNAGVQALHVNLDESSIQRVASACNRQNYRPVILIPGGAQTDRMKDVPGLDGAMAVSGVFPYFATGTPATDEFQQAMRAFGNGVMRGYAVAEGWVSGKLFERATAELAEPPTTAGILAGLWKIKNDNLGGLTGNLTFTENQPAANPVCGSVIVIKDKAWTAPYAVRCFQ